MTVKKNIFFFHGKDKNHFKHYCEKIVNEKIFSQKTNVEVIEFNGYELADEQRLAQLELFLTNESLFDPEKNKKVFVIWDYHLLSQSKKIEKLVMSSLPSYYLFFFSKEKKRLHGLEKKLKDKILVVEEKYVNKQFIKTKIKDFFVNKVAFSTTTLSYLAERFAKELDSLDNELEKIFLYLYPNKKASLEDVKKIMVDHEDEEKVYVLMNSFFTRKKKIILNEALNFISSKSNFNQFVSLMIRELSMVLHLVENKNTKKDDSIFNELKVFHPFQREGLIKKSSAFKKSELLFLMDKFINLEKKMKSSPFPKHHNYKNIDLVSINYFIRIVLYVC